MYQWFKGMVLRFLEMDETLLKHSAVNMRHTTFHSGKSKINAHTL